MSAQYDGSIKFDTKIDSDKFEKGVSNLKKAAIASATGIGVALAGAAVKGGKYALSLASDLQEVQNVVDVTFGSNADKIETWAKKAGKNFGMAELAAKQYTGTMGAMLKSMGLSDDAVLKMSTDLTGLAGDFASFYNLDHSAAFEKIRAGISGETEPLKQLGINMSVANLEAYALSQGIKTAYKAMSQAEQATLRYNYILQAGADAQGDFARTSDSFANQLRIAQLSVTEIASSIGEKLLPIATGAMQGINSGLTWLSETVGGHKSEIDLLIESIDAQSAAYEEQKIIQGQKTSADLAELEHIKQLSNELTRLVDANGRVADSDKSRAEFILNELNSALGTEYSLTGNIIENYDRMQNSILGLIEAKHLEILMQEAETNYANAIKSKTDAETKYAEAHKAHLLTNTEETRIALEKARADFEKCTQDQNAYAEASRLALEGETAAAISYLEEYNAAYRDSINAAEQFADGTKAKLDALKSNFDNNLSILHGYIELYNETGSETAKSYVDSFVDKVIESRDEYVAAGGTVANEFVAALNSNSENIDFTQLEESIGLQLKGVSQATYDALVSGVAANTSRILLKYDEGIEAGLTKSEAATQALISSAITTTDECQTKPTTELGVDFSHGFAAGIGEGKSAAVNAAVLMMRDAVTAAKTEGDINSPSRVAKDEIGKWVPIGMANGIEENTNEVIAASVDMVRASIDAAKTEVDTNSIFGVAKDEIGKWIPLGVAQGIEENSEEVVKSFNAMLDRLEYNRNFDIIDDEQYYAELEKYRDKYLKTGSKEWLDSTLEIYDYQQKAAKEAQDKELRDLKYKCDMGEITEAEYYAELEKYRDKYFEEGSEDWQQYTVEIHNYQQRMLDEAERVAKEARDKELRDLKYKCDVGEITEAEYYEELEKYRDKYFEVGSEEWQQYTVEIYNYQQKLLEDEKKLLEEQKNETKQMYDDIVDYALDKLGEVEKKQESYSKKLSSYGTLFTHNTIKFGEETIEYYSLADIDKDISAISAYNDKMVAFKNSLSDMGISDKAANAYLEEINNLSVDEGTKVLDALLKTDKGKLAEYLGEYEKKLVYSEGAAATYYYDDMADAVSDSYQNMVNKLTEAGFEVPEGWKASGTLSAKNFGEAFITEIDNQLAQIGTKIDGYLARFQALRTYGINDNAGTVYQDNRKSDTVIVVQSEQQAIETKRQNDIYEQHTKGW